MAVRQTIEFTKGFFFFFKGLRKVFSSWPLFSRSAAPLLVNIFVFVLFLLSFNTVVYYLANWAFEQTSQAWYWAMLSFIAGAVLFSVSLLVVVFLFAAIGLIIASPFLDILSVEVERSITGQVEESGKPFFIQALGTMRSEAKKLAVFLPIQLAIVLLSLIPVAGPIIFAIFNPIFLSFVMAFEFTSFTLDRRGFDFNAKRSKIMEAPGLHLGFGAAAGLTLLIPIVHFLMLPAAAAGGTLLALETSPKSIAPKADEGQSADENPPQQTQPDG